MQSSNNIRLGYKAVHMNGHVYTTIHKQLPVFVQRTIKMCAANAVYAPSSV